MAHKTDFAHGVNQRKIVTLAPTIDRSLLTYKTSFSQNEFWTQCCTFYDNMYQFKIGNYDPEITKRILLWITPR